jgi:hypothetical protein
MSAQAELASGVAAETAATNAAAAKVETIKLIAGTCGRTAGANRRRADWRLFGVGLPIL